MLRLRIISIPALLLLVGLLAGCASQASNQPDAGPTLTPRPATEVDRALIRSALLDAGGLKSFQKTIAMTDTLYGFDESSLAEQAAEVYVKAPGEFYVKAHRKGKPLEVLGTNRLLYTRDEAGNWVLNEEEKLRSDTELWINTSFDGPIQVLDEGQTATDTQAEEVINGVRARLFTWEMKNETGWFTGSTSKDSALIDLATGRLHRLVGCIVLDKDPTKVNCITHTISRHNEPVSIPDAPPASTSQAHIQAIVTAPLYGTGAIRTLEGEELNRLDIGFRRQISE